MKEKSFLMNNRKVYEYHELDDYIYDDDSNSKERRFHQMNLKRDFSVNFNSFQKFYETLLDNIKNFYFTIINKRDGEVRNLFYLLIFVLWLENFLGHLCVI